MNVAELDRKIDYDNRREFAELAAWMVFMLSPKVEFIPEPDAIPPF